MENVKQENRLTIMEQKIDNLIEDVKEISKDIKSHIASEADRYDKLDNKYSGKWVETLTLVIAGGLVVSILGGIFFLIVK